MCGSFKTRRTWIGVQALPGMRNATSQSVWKAVRPAVQMGHGLVLRPSDVPPWLSLGVQPTLDAGSATSWASPTLSLSFPIWKV